MPRLSSLIDKSSIGTLSTHPHSDPQPVWAEILTTEPWYKNGCAGYAAPRRSLNEVKPVYERDLSCSLRLLENFQKPILFNVPLVEPSPESRIWFADAGHPSINAVSPPPLLERAPYSSYKSRAVASMGYALADNSESFKTFFAFERTHLKCAKAICSEANWDLLIYRSAIFDQLAHLFGTEFVTEKHLLARPALEKIAQEMDEFFASVMKQTDRTIIFSTFSHATCSAIVSINDFFVSEKLQVRSETDSTVLSLRKKALAAARPEEALASLQAVSGTLEFLPSKTFLASPVRGCIYLNVKDRFLDGIVETDCLERNIEQASERLTKHLSRHCDNATISRNAQTASMAPHLVVTAPGVELIDSFTIVKTNELPHSVHVPDGFIWSSTNPRLNKVNPSDFFEVMM